MRESRLPWSTRAARTCRSAIITSAPAMPRKKRARNMWRTWPTCWRLMGEPADKAAADAQKIMTLETALAKVSMDVTSRRDPNNVYHLLPAAKLAAARRRRLIGRSSSRDTGVPGITDLNVANPDFFKGLEDRS